MNDDGRRSIDDGPRAEFHSKGIRPLAVRRTAVDGERPTRQRNTQDALRKTQYHSDPSWHSRASIELDIAELVLDGFTNLRGELVAASIERELARLFAERGVPAWLHSEIAVPALEAGALQLQADAHSSDAGIQIALALYNELKQ